MPGVVQPLPAMNVTIARINNLFDKRELHVFHRDEKLDAAGVVAVGVRNALASRLRKNTVRNDQKEVSRQQSKSGFMSS